MRRFVITAAHCVSRFDFGRIKIFPELRLRIPRLPWKGFLEGHKKYRAGAMDIEELFDSIVVQKEHVFIHNKYDGHWMSGYDIAMVAIPEISPRESTSLHFATCERNSFPSSICINGFPAMKSAKNRSYTHMPYYSALNRAENDVEWQLSFRKRIIDYPLPTQPGISGGALIIDDVIMGIHTAKKEARAGHGTMFTKELQSWITKTYSKWDPALGQFSQTDV